MIEFIWCYGFERVLENLCIGKSLTHETFVSFFRHLLVNEQQAKATTTLSLTLIIHKPHFLPHSLVTVLRFYCLYFLLAHFLHTTRLTIVKVIIFHPNSYIFKTKRVPNSRGMKWMGRRDFRA